MAESHDVEAIKALVDELAASYQKMGANSAAAYSKAYAEVGRSLMPALKRSEVIALCHPERVKEPVQNGADKLWRLTNEEQVVNLSFSERARLCLKTCKKGESRVIVCKNHEEAVSTQGVLRHVVGTLGWRKGDSYTSTVLDVRAMYMAEPVVLLLVKRL